MTTDGILRDDLEALRHSLSACGRCANAILTEHDFEPASGSVASEEMALDAEFGAAWGDDPVFETWAHALGLLAASEDYLRGLQLLLSAEAEVSLAPMPIVRAALECSARAYWLAEPHADIRTRIARGMNERLFSLYEVLKLPIAAAQDHAKVRVAKILSGARAHDFSLTEGSGPKYLAGATRPNGTDAVARLLRHGRVPTGEIAYRAYSAPGHGTVFGVFQQFEALPDDGQHRTRRRATLVKRPVTTAVMAAVSLDAYLTARSRQLDAYGRVSDHWRSWVEHTLREIKRVASAASPPADTVGAIDRGSF